MLIAQVIEIWHFSYDLDSAFYALVKISIELSVAGVNLSE